MMNVVCFVRESAVIQTDMRTIWKMIRTLEFDFHPAMQGQRIGVSTDDNTDAVLGKFVIDYADGTTQVVRLTEISDECVPGECSISMELVESTPSITYSGRTDRIQLRSVSYSSYAATYIEFTSNFSSDATAEIISDSKFKKHEFFDALNLRCSRLGS